MHPILFYTMMGCMIALFIIDNPKESWARMSRKQVIADVIICSVFWPIFTAGVVYGFFKGRRK